MTRRVVFAPEAQIAEHSGAARAIAYVERIEARCLGLRDFPERGTRRDDLWPGLRVTGFERRAAIAFLVAEDAVTILRILHAGRDLGEHSRRMTMADPARRLRRSRRTPYSNVIFATRATSRQRSISAAISAPNSSGVPAT